MNASLVILNDGFRYWYASFVACYFDPKTCTWHHIRDRVKIEYDLWFVNGNPNWSSFNPFTYQFSFDKHVSDIFRMFRAGSCQE